jgi:hypothetical protein
MGHKRRREKVLREFNKLPHKQQRQFLKVITCQKFYFDNECRNDFMYNNYYKKDRTKEPKAKLLAKYRNNDIDDKVTGLYQYVS